MKNAKKITKSTVNPTILNIRKIDEDPEEEPMFRQILPRAMWEGGRKGNSGNADVVRAEWSLLKAHHPFVNKGERVTHQKFGSTISRGQREIATWSYIDYFYTQTCLEQDLMKGKGFFTHLLL